MMSGVAALLTALLIFQRMGGAIRWFATMMLCVSVWSIFYAIELSCSTLEDMMFWIKLEYIGISFLPATWIMFMIKFVGKDQWLTLRNRIIIFSFPSLALFFVWTNNWHHIHYEAVSVDNSGPFPLLAITPGIWYQIHTVFFYFMLLWGILLLLQKFRSAGSIYRRQNSMIIIGALIPWVFNFIYLLGVRPFGHIDLTPYAFIITSIVIGLGLLKFSLFDLIPVAREKIIENMREGVLILDSHSRIVDANNGIMKILKPFHNNVLGKTLSEIFPNEKVLLDWVKGTEDRRLDILMDSEERTRYFEINITPIADHNTIISGTLLIFSDVTERRVAQTILQEQADELKDLNEVKDKLFTIISHDLRSPLASLSSILDFAESGDISAEEFQGFLPSLAQNVENTSRLIENLLFWSKSQLEGESIVPEEFDIMELAEQNISFFASKAVEKKIVLVQQLNEPFKVYADKSMIQLVLRNLISNAIKFCNEGDRITISASVEDNKVSVCIKDTGIGMNKEALAKVMGNETYTTLGTKRERGTGLGLMLCRDFVTKNKGIFTVKSEEGKGSLFCFTLPAR
jgi:PAS domain S-box-containing protein